MAYYGIFWPSCDHIPGGLVPEQQENSQGVNEGQCDSLGNTQIYTNLNYPNEGFLCHV